MSRPGERKEEPPFLRAEALERIGGDADFLEELLGIYRAEYAKKRKGLDRALSKKDAEAVRELGHSLKGSSANLSLPGLRSAALEVENAGRAGDMTAAARAAERLGREYARLTDYLAGPLKSRPRP